MMKTIGKILVRQLHLNECMKMLSVIATFLMLLLPLQGFANCCPSVQHMHHEGAATPLTATCAMTPSPQSIFEQSSTTSPNVSLPAIYAKDLPDTASPVEETSAAITVFFYPSLLLTPLRI
jgi:hypothetical protein